MKIPDRHQSALVRYFQAESDDLEVDGLYGPETAAEIDAYLADRGEPSIPAIQRAFESAIDDVGRAEDPLGSNSGLYIESLRKEAGLRRLGGGEWCSVLLSVHCMRAGIDAKSRTALGLMRAVEALPGGEYVAIGDIRPGFYGLALKRRGRHKHHVQIFHCCIGSAGSTLIQHLGGNEDHRVQSRMWEPTKFFADCLQVVTYRDPS